MKDKSKYSSETDFFDETQDTLSLGAGSYLARERELRGISLTDISKVTKISMGVLETLETDNYQALPAPAFVKGFLRTYADYIGIDPEDVLLRYNHYENTEDGTFSSTNFKGRLKSKKKLIFRKKNKRKKIVFAIIIVVVFLITTLLLIGRDVFSNKQIDSVNLIEP